MLISVQSVHYFTRPRSHQLESQAHSPISNVSLLPEHLCLPQRIQISTLSQRNETDIFGSMADICIVHEGTQVSVPYEVVNMILIAKEISGTPHETCPTLVDEYVARILKYWAPAKESASVKYDYRVLLEQKSVQQIYQSVHEQGGLWRAFPEKQPLAASTVLKAILETTKTMHYWRGLDPYERKAIKKMRKHWRQALMEELDEEDETIVLSDTELETYHLQREGVAHPDSHKQASAGLSSL